MTIRVNIQKKHRLFVLLLFSSLLTVKTNAMHSRASTPEPDDRQPATAPTTPQHIPRRGPPTMPPTPERVNPRTNDSDSDDDITCLICLEKLTKNNRTGTDRFRCPQGFNHGAMMHYNCMDQQRLCPLCKGERITFPEDNLRHALHLTCLRKVQEHAASCSDISNVRYAFDLTPLHIVALALPQEGRDFEEFFTTQKEIVTFLLATCHVPIDATDSGGRTALHLALIRGNIPLACNLIQSGASIHTRENIWNAQALDIAAACGHPASLTNESLIPFFIRETPQKVQLFLPVIKKLIDAGAQRDTGERTPYEIMLACIDPSENGYEELMELLSY